MTDLTIVMYHYIRPIIGSEFPGIKGLEIEGFKRQLDFLENNYSIVSSEQVIDKIIKNKKLPPKACWLTFDDGYKDHYQYVLPELINRNLSGAFFPPRVAIKENKVLDVNSIHHILSCSDDNNKLVADLNDLCLQFGMTNEQIHAYYKEYGVANRFDNADTIFIKRMLQHVLPEQIRNEIVSILFEKIVGIPEAKFSSRLYMNIDEVRKLVSSGMYVGSHGSMHYWLDRISSQKQKVDISSSVQFLEEVGAPTSNWIMCYPYGAYNNTTLSLLKELGALIGITTEVRKANLGIDNPLTLPRLDTNDFPQ
ncbi:polysaccharide deacetylase family protein [Candidatus Pelagibacter bacterium]|nr:polysaccharide deacetylase family protein [Candidatus Pelagibacter bacterium]